MDQPAGRQVFLYGSLLSAASLARTLPGEVAPVDQAPFTLHGWSRTWNVVSARTFALADDPGGPLHRRLVLGIRPDPAGRCEGVVRPFTHEELAQLAERESAYSLEVVATDRRAALVWSYLPRPPRTLGHHHVDEPLVVEQAYLDECRSGIAAHGLASADEELTASLRGLRIADAAP